MKLHEDQALFKDAIQATADFLGIKEIYVEKDYWVTLALYTIFHSEFVKDQVVFKGGTALSKCYKLIERFSEDIDLALLKKVDESGNQLKKRMQSVGQSIDDVLPEIDVKGLTNKRGNIRKTVHQYPKVYEGVFGQVRDQIILEVSSLGNFEPYSSMAIESYVYEMMRSRGLDDFITQYHLAPFSILVLSKKRTFCEKIMSLVKFSHTDAPIINLRNKVRHIYDIHQMLKDEEVNAFFEGSEFDEMLLKVGNDDVVGYKNNSTWLFEHPAQALIFAEPNNTWLQLVTEYNTNFKDLLIGDLPNQSDIAITLQLVSKRIKLVDWTLKN